MCPSLVYNCLCTTFLLFRLFLVILWVSVGVGFASIGTV